MRAGRLRHRIAFQTSTDTKDAGGGLVETWTTINTVWGAVIPLSGRELANAQMMNSEITHRLEIRYLSTINAKGRALFGSRIFPLFGVLNIDERNREMHIGAKEVLP